MTFVVDSSVAICWLMPDETHPVDSAAWQRIMTEPFVAPALWWFEVRNILLVNERRGRLDETKTAQALALLGQLPVGLDNSFDEASLMRLARAHRLTAYDAAYLDLAQRRAYPLATLDSALAAAAKAEAVQLIEGVASSP